MTDLEAVLANVTNADHASRLVAADALDEVGRADEAKILRDVAWPCAVGRHVTYTRLKPSEVPEGRQFWVPVSSARTFGGSLCAVRDWQSNCQPTEPSGITRIFAMPAVRYGQVVYHGPYDDMRHEWPLADQGRYYDDLPMLALAPDWEVPQSARESHQLAERLRPGPWQQLPGWHEGAAAWQCACKCGFDLGPLSFRDYEPLLSLKVRHVTMPMRKFLWVTTSDSGMTIRRFEVAYFIGQCEWCDAVYWAHAITRPNSYTTVAR
jgi:hypothetical protein